ncbi:MAG: superoxide dismutase [Sulfurimonas sp.]|uniref:superoxide dismutase n=1 Tax=Sulfurimonas sp. TaxID=2022749 RepID=UPI0028CE6C9E|nr:superoxide dismutase [Sulfurimonas sp.]MDT8338297.1 superoxide dismutase [Sulfurimonas sp.]
MKFELMKLPYEDTALEPYISSETISYHYGKHHAAYVNKLNALIQESEFEGKSLEYIIKNSQGGIFNNAAQVYNHDFYWHGLTNTASSPSVALSDMIDRDFGSMDEFKKLFLDKAATFFGSGWVWLVLGKDNKLSIEGLSNADNPLAHNKVALLACDVWEHAYYIDYRNARPDYLENWWKLINWKFVSDNLADAQIDPSNKYSQPCNENNEVCDYVDFMQENERTPS